MIRSSRWVFVLWLAALLFVHRYFFEGSIEVGRDIFRLFIPEATFLRDRLLRGELPLWNPYVRLGQPFAATLTSEAFYPPHVVLVLLLGPTWGMEASIVFHAALGSGGAYFASRRLGAGRWGGLVAGSLAFTPLFTKLIGSLHMVSAIAWSGLVVAAALNVAREPSIRASAWLALPLALSFLCGAPEVVIWQGALAAALALTGRAPVKGLLFAAVSVGWCVALCALVILPAAELWRMSVRPGTGQMEGALTWSTSPAQLASMFWPWADEKKSPEFAGPDQWLTTTLFVSSNLGLLALASLRRSKKIAAIAGVGLLCATVCLGAHFAPARLLLSIPPLSGFRHPVKYAFGFSFCLALLSGQGLRRLKVWARRERTRTRAVAIAIAGSFVLLYVLQGIAALVPWREGMKSGTLWFGFCAAVLAICFAAMSGGWRGSKRVALAAVGCTVLELAAGNVLTGNVALVSAQKLGQPGKLAALIRAEPHGRMSIVVEDGETLPELQEGDRKGKYPFKQYITDSRENLLALRPYEESLVMIEGYGFRPPWRQTDALEEESRGAYDVFGVTHFLRRGAAPYPDLEPVNEHGFIRAFRSHTAFPRAWVVNEAVVVSDGRALGMLKNEAPLLRTTVALAEGEPLSGPKCESRVSVEELSAESLRFELDACAKGYLVVADSHYPGWVATVNDQARPIYRANYLLRAVPIDAGHAMLSMQYRPTSFRVGLWVSILGWAAGFWVLAVKDRRKPLKPLTDAASSR